MTVKKDYEIKKTLISTTGLGLLLVILILANWILSHANIRWDTTEDRIYSLSEGTRKILSGMGSPVTVKFFYSLSNRDLPPSLKLYAKRMREFLSEYEHAGKGRLTVEVHDPRVDSDEEEWAQKYGMQPLQLSTGEKVYCGLTFLAADQEERIPLLDPAREELLEYDLTRIVHRLQSPEKKVLGVISTLPVFGLPQGMPFADPRPGAGPWFFITEMEKSYEVRKIDLTAESIDEDVDLLVIVHPRELGEKVLYAVDQYVLAGGNALIFVDPFCLSDMSQVGQQLPIPPASSMEKLFSAWGVVMEREKVLADFDQTTGIRTGDNTVENSPVWISARDMAFSKTDVVTSRLENMLFPLAGAIKKAEGSGHEFEPLVRSGENAALIDAFKVNMGTAAIRRDFVPAKARFNIVARIRGRFNTAFPDGPPRAEKEVSGSKEGPERGHLATGKEKATLIIVADADMLADRFYMQRGRVLGFSLSSVFNDNLNFLANAGEILTGSDDLVDLRSRGKFERPFTSLLELERQAQERWLSKENELASRAEATNRKLQELEQRKDDSQQLILSPEQEKEISRFKEERMRLNRELKQVRKNLRADIENLGALLKALNIFLMPLCVSVIGMGFALYRQRRVKKR